MENLEIILNLPNLKLNIPEESLNFHPAEDLGAIEGNIDKTLANRFKSICLSFRELKLNNFLR